MTKILIANRGEIAVRIIRACRELGLGCVAVYSDCDRAALHVRLADEAYHIGASPPGESYLDIDRVVDAGRRAGVWGVHPGYGFLAERGDFARACARAGLVFIGPSPDAIDAMGSKTAARRIAMDAGVPVVPGTDAPIGPEVAVREVEETASRVGYPLLVKAVAGGGGKGMRRVDAGADLPSALRAARSEAGASFGDPAVYLERVIEHPRHVEVQLLGDAHGGVVPFVERECSIQRRHQKVIEESPSPVLDEATRRQMADAAAAIARSVGYTNAGTIEFLLDRTGRFYFLEMNTRLQVEHPITELVTGVDLVHWQFRIAQGDRLDLDRDAVLRPRGHAIECRIYAENPDRGFLPSPGRIEALRPSAGPGIREDSGVEAGSAVPIYYDPLVSKLAAWGRDRGQALARMRRALAEYRLTGIQTTIPFFQWIFDQQDFVAGAFDTGYIDAALARRDGGGFVSQDRPPDEVAAIAAAVHMHLAAAAPAAGSTAALPRQTAWSLQARIEGRRGDCR